MKAIVYEDFDQFLDDADRVLDTIKIVEVDKSGKATARFWWRYMWMMYQGSNQSEVEQIQQRGFKRARLFEIVEIKET